MYLRCLYVVQVSFVAVEAVRLSCLSCPYMLYRVGMSLQHLLCCSGRVGNGIISPRFALTGGIATGRRVWF